MTDRTSAQKTNDEIFQDLKNKSTELKKKHETTTRKLKELNETSEKILEKSNQDKKGRQ